MDLGARFNRLTGKTRYAVTRVFLQLRGEEISTLLGTLNRAVLTALDQEGDLNVLGEGLVEVCQALLQRPLDWYASGNEGEVFWREEEAGDFFNELFTDSAQRYLSELPERSELEADLPLTLPLTPNLVVMLTAAYTGEAPDLETALTDPEALTYGLKALVNLHYQDRLEAIQIHFSPARLGEVLEDEQVLLNFPELIPL
ncbi:MAG: hypothetical protein GC158_10770 [Cyanobacteria bacterium RI_101]|nr:hypothetical protein [Cyanobacteria bacterium RI_101]